MCPPAMPHFSVALAPAGPRSWRPHASPPRTARHPGRGAGRPAGHGGGAARAGLTDSRGRVGMRDPPTRENKARGGARQGGSSPAAGRESPAGSRDVEGCEDWRSGRNVPRGLGCSGCWRARAGEPWCGWRRRAPPTTGTSRTWAGAATHLPSCGRGAGARSRLRGCRGAHRGPRPIPFVDGAGLGRLAPPPHARLARARLPRRRARSGGAKGGASRRVDPADGAGGAAAVVAAPASPAGPAGSCARLVALAPASPAPGTTASLSTAQATVDGEVRL